jgi:hypothetical protein
MLADAIQPERRSQTHINIELAQYDITGRIFSAAVRIFEG